MAFSHHKGEKFAVHCHAGLGRTGLAIACYLVFAQNYSATNVPSINQAILLVRGKRPLSVQTKKQALFVARFESYLKNLQLFFPRVISKTQKDEVPCDLLNFQSFMANQRWWLSIDEVRYLRTVPKVKRPDPDCP
jgi:protein tyrosine phosphatase domain-containing protein 1